VSGRWPHRLFWILVVGRRFVGPQEQQRRRRRQEEEAERGAESRRRRIAQQPDAAQQTIPASATSDGLKENNKTPNQIINNWKNDFNGHRTKNKTTKLFFSNFSNFRAKKNISNARGINQLLFFTATKIPLSFSNSFELIVTIFEIIL
jgi:hypothetical protein